MKQNMEAPQSSGCTPIRGAKAEPCPQCGVPGKAVKRITLQSLLRSEKRTEVQEQAYYFCATKGCDTVYFAAANGQRFTKGDLTVRVGVKETIPPRPICYCFDHTVEEIHEEIRRTGKSTVLERIKADMKGPGCRCEYTNPMGACCLKSVAAVVEEGFRLYGHDSEPAGQADEPDDCCAGSEPVRPPSPGGKKRVLTPLGAVLAAVGASACCWLPLLLGAVGLSAVGAASFFQTYRPVFLALAVLLIGVGFYRVYFRKQVCAAGSPCATRKGAGGRSAKISLWATTALATGLIFFPNYVGYLWGGTPTKQVETAPGETILHFQISGMTCQGCAALADKAIAAVPGVKSVAVSFDEKRAEVGVAGSDQAIARQIVRAVEKAGYKANLVEAAATRDSIGVVQNEE